MVTRNTSRRPPKWVEGCVFLFLAFGCLFAMYYNFKTGEFPLTRKVIKREEEPIAFMVFQLIALAAVIGGFVMSVRSFWQQITGRRDKRHE